MYCHKEDATKEDITKESATKEDATKEEKPQVLRLEAFFGN